VLNDQGALGKEPKPCSLDLWHTGRFPRIRVPSLDERDLRQLLVHRMRQVRARTQVKNPLHALAISHGVCRKRKLWSAQGRKDLESLALLPWAARRRKELLASLDRAVEEAGRESPEVARLCTHPGVGRVVSLAFVLTVGPIERFSHSRALHLLVRPRDGDSAAGKRRTYMPIAVVRLGTPRRPHEGLRLGTVRRPPRGVPKAEFAKRNFYDVWLPNLAPSAELVAFALQAKEERSWIAFARKYRAEMNKPEAARVLDVLAALSHQTSFSVGCYCENEERCHRSILKKLLAERGAEVVS